MNDNKVEELKIIFEQKKAEIEQQKLTINNNNSIINISLDLKIHYIKYNENVLDDDLINQINISINSAKKEFEKKWTDYIKSYGVSF